MDLNASPFSIHTNWITLIALATFFLAFYHLRNGMNEKVAVISILAIHLTNFAWNDISVLEASHFCVLLPCVGFLLTSTKSIQFMNIGLCFIQNLTHIYTINQRFTNTFSIEQEFEIKAHRYFSFFLLSLSSILFYAHKYIKTHLWQLAQDNYRKTEEIAKEVLQAAKSKDTFVSSLSHEIRNPLNCMNGSIDYLLRVVENPAHLQILNNAKVSGEVLLNLLNNVLDAAKLKSDKMELAYSESSSLDSIKKVLVIYSERIKQKHLGVNVFVDKCIPPVVWIDPSRLLQIMINLFSNAMKFTPEAGKIEVYLKWYDEDLQNKDELLTPIVDYSTNPEEPNRHNTTADTLTTTSLKNLKSLPRVQSEESIICEEFNHIENELRKNNLQYLKVQKIKELKKPPTQRSQIDERFTLYHIDDDMTTNMLQIPDFNVLINGRAESLNKKGYLKIQISDSGCGIKEENIPKLFEMFGQADHTVGSIYGGSGLGLWLCRQLSQKMGGDITLYSEFNKGTSFVLYFPVNNEQLSMPTHTKGNLTHENLRALVVDDYGYNRDVHKLLLEKENVQVTLACNGVEAVDAYTRHEDDYYQFILMDVKMPEMDGFAAAKKIREWEAEKKRKRVDIYFVSGEYYNEEEVLREMRREGGVADIEGIKCLRKPIDVEKIKKLLFNYNKISKFDYRPRTTSTNKK
jgi:signal transduction histidine kinase/CheY-like chemotaxis protein